MWHDLSKRGWGTRILKIILIGVLACAVMDAWNLILFFIADITLDWHLLGRWIGHLMQGDFMLYGVDKLSPVLGENTIGWVGHYVTGVAYAFIYLFFMYKILKRRPSLLSAILVAWFFMFMPFCLYQPAVGMGYFASLAPNQLYAIIITISMHTAFGVGLYLGCWVAWHFHKVLPFSREDE